MKAVTFVVSSAAAFLVFSSTALADDSVSPDSPKLAPQASQKDPSRELKSVAVTLSPFHLIVGVGEVSVEGRLGKKFGLGGTFGAGAYGNPFDKSTTKRIPLVEGGISPRYYLVGDFDHGMQLGAEVQTIVAWNSSETAYAVAAAPYVGYKFTAPVGFTLELQGGCGYAYATAKNAGTTAKGVLPVLNINLGWAF